MKAGETQTNVQFHDTDGDNLLNVAYGATVVSRTAESTLESSAVQGIDGMNFTAFATPAKGPEQTLVFAFGAPSRVERLGVTCNDKAKLPSKVRFEASADGHAWGDVITIDHIEQGENIRNVPPFDARYLRVHIVEATPKYVTIGSFHAIGREIAAAQPASFDGCWMINNKPARLVQRGGRIFGVMGGTRPTLIDGGTNGRVATLMWTRGPMWGYAVAAVAPNGKAISAATFHEEALTGNYGEAWIGTRCDATPALAAPAAPQHFLARTGHWTLSGLLFDPRDRLIEEASADTIDNIVAILAAAPTRCFRIRAHEFRSGVAKEDQRQTAARIESLRAALQRRGVDLTRIEPVAGGSRREDAETVFASQRLLWSRIDLEPLR
jgi:hypothetical protein